MEYRFPAAGPEAVPSFFAHPLSAMPASKTPQTNL
jgi:hypothetical protein